MRVRIAATLLVALALAPPATAQQAKESIAAIQVQGNTATPDEQVLRLADVRIGMPFDDATVDAVATRLRAAKRFESIEVRKRYAAIADPPQTTRGYRHARRRRDGGRGRDAAARGETLRIDRSAQAVRVDRRPLADHAGDRR